MLEVPEVMRCVQLCMLEVMRCVGGDALCRRGCTVSEVLRCVRGDALCRK